MKTKINPAQFRVREGSKVNLKKWATLISPYYKSKEHYQELLAHFTYELSHLQQLLYANDQHSLLLIFQAMDAAGKDGAIKHVMSGVNPQGCEVYSFKHPSPTELDHDFLWRCCESLPQRGRIGIFNRSYYEEVLIVRVHPEILLAQKLPPEVRKHKDIWGERYTSILNLEKHLTNNGTHVVKIFLHLSKEEQRKRFLKRIDDPEKNWKFSEADLTERKFWREYQAAYTQCLTETSTEESPWYIVPADDKENARLIVSKIIIETLKALDLKFPQVSAERHKELLKLRKKLEKKAKD